jgi:hypothetical protein
MTVAEQFIEKGRLRDIAEDEAIGKWEHAN